MLAKRRTRGDSVLLLAGCLGKIVTSSRSHTEDPSRQEAVDNPGRSSPRFMPALDNTEQDYVLNFLLSLVR